MAMKAVLFLVFLLLSNIGETTKLVNGEEWCIAKSSTYEVDLKNNIDYACGYVDCSAIRPGGECFKPDITISHASFAMNLYYKAQGSNPWNCDFTKTGFVVTKDPSFGDCHYK